MSAQQGQRSWEYIWHILKLQLQRSRSPLNNSLFSHTGNGYPRESPTRTTNGKVSSLRLGQLKARKNCSWKGTFAVRSSERSPAIWISFLFACQNGLHSLNSYEYRDKGPENKPTQHIAHPVHLEEIPSRKSAGPTPPWPLTYLLMPCCIVRTQCSWVARTCCRAAMESVPSHLFPIIMRGESGLPSGVPATSTHRVC